MVAGFDGGLVKTQIAGPHRRVPGLVSLNLSSKFPGEAGDTRPQTSRWEPIC